MRPLTILTGLLFIVVLLWSLFRQVSMNSELEITKARADSLYAVAVEVQSAYDDLELQQRLKIDSALVVRDSALAVARLAGSRRHIVIERAVERAGADSAAVREGITTVVDSMVEEEVKPRDVALAKDAEIIALLEDKLRRADLTIVSLRTALEAARADAEALRVSRPSRWAQVRQAVTYGLMGALVGAAVR